MTDNRMENLRRRIRHLDAALLGLIAERMELAREVGAAKAAAGIALRDFEVEKRVLERAGATAEELGLAPDTARSLMRVLIEESCRVQEEEHFSEFSGDAETVLVVGGAGKMGRWLTRFLLNQGHRVRVHDPGSGATSADTPVLATLEAGLAGATMALIATPLDVVAPTAENIAGLGFPGIVCDIASLKAHLREPLARCRALGARVTSIHPMFGPGTRTLSDKVVAICDCGDTEATERVTALFRETAARLVPLSLEQHDRVAAYVLGLSHFVNLLFARVLEQSGLSRAELDAVASTTFQAQFETASAVLRESPALYFEIQRLNPETPALYRQLQAALGDWTRWVEGNEMAAFGEAMRSGRDWLEATGPTAPSD